MELVPSSAVGKLSRAPPSTQYCFSSSKLTLGLRDTTVLYNVAEKQFMSLSKDRTSNTDLVLLLVVLMVLVVVLVVALFLAPLDASC